MSKIQERLNRVEQDLLVLQIRIDTLARLPEVQQYVAFAQEVQKLQSEKDLLTETSGAPDKADEPETVPAG